MGELWRRAMARFKNEPVSNDHSDDVFMSWQVKRLTAILPVLCLMLALLLSAVPTPASATTSGYYTHNVINETTKTAQLNYIDNTAQGFEINNIEGMPSWIIPWQDYPVAPFILGDMNKDWRINILDILFINAYIGQPVTDIKAYKSDINNDNQVSMEDLLTVAQYMGSYEGIITEGVNYYALVLKIGKENRKDVAYLLNHKGLKQSLVIEDASIKDYTVSGVDKNATLAVGDFISYSVEANGDGDTVRILAHKAGRFFDSANISYLSELNMDKIVTGIVVKASTLSSIKDTDDKYYALTNKTVRFQNYDANLLKVVSGVSKGQTVMLIDTDDDGGAYDYVLIGLDD